MIKQKRILTSWIIFIFFIMFLGFFSESSYNHKNILPFSEIVMALKNGKVQKIIISNERFFFGSLKNGEHFFCNGTYSDSIVNILDYAQEKHHTQYSIELIKKKFITSVFLSIFPFMFILLAIYILMRQLQAGNSRTMSFGKSHAKVHIENTRITFSDVAGIDECKEELQEVVDFLKTPKKYTALGGQIPKGVLLIGAPGTGKTLLAKAVAGEAKVPFFTTSGSDFVEMFVGVGASRVRNLFKQGKEKAPCIIFIDEIDAVGRQRGSNISGGNDEREQTLNQLLVEMDGFDEHAGIIVIAATNRPDILDRAILRPGRFDRRITIPLPDLSGRKEIFRVHTKNISLTDDVDLDILAKVTPGMSGADIANLVNESALIAAKKNHRNVQMVDLEEAQEKIIMGLEKRSMVMDFKEYCKTAYHESGHALVAALLPDVDDPVHKISIIPRGRALGVTIQLPQKDRYSISKKYLNNQICILVSGRIAEEIIFNEISSGASDDFDKATKIAKTMVCDLGMSKTLGTIKYDKESVSNISSMDEQSLYSDRTIKSIDHEIKKIIDVQYRRSRYIIEKNMHILHKLSNTLIRYETISGEELELIVGGLKIFN